MAELGTNPKDLLGAKKPSVGLIPVGAMNSVARVMELGARKYGPYNWRSNKIQLMVYANACLRHLHQWIGGQSTDDESGEPHLAHAAACMMIALDAIATGNAVDDRSWPTDANAEQRKRLAEANAMLGVLRQVDALPMTAKEVIRRQNDAMIDKAFGFYGERPFDVGRMLDKVVNPPVREAWVDQGDGTYRKELRPIYGYGRSPLESVNMDAVAEAMGAMLTPPARKWFKVKRKPRRKPVAKRRRTT